MDILSLVLINILMCVVVFLLEYQFKNKYVNSAADYIIVLLVVLSLFIGDMNDSIAIPISIFMVVVFVELRRWKSFKRYSTRHQIYLHAKTEILEEELSKK